MSIQGDADGAQLLNIFKAVNILAGSKIIDEGLNYNTGDQYSNMIANGSQIKDAFAAINTHYAAKLLDTSQSFNATNGTQLKKEVIKLILLTGIEPAPVWGDIPQQNAAQGEPWGLDLNDYVVASGIPTFTLSIGILPTGISLNSNGTFTGTITNENGVGSAVFEAQDVNSKTTLSGTMDWDIGGAAVVTVNSALDMDKDGKPDTVIFVDGDITITEDEDSYNVDTDGDGEMDNQSMKEDSKD